MKCEYCNHWKGAGFSSLMSLPDALDGTPRSTYRHFESDPKVFSGKCRRYPQEVVVSSNHCCGEFDVQHGVLDVLSTELAAAHHELRLSQIYHKGALKRLSGSRETNRKLRAKLLALQLKETS